MTRYKLSVNALDGSQSLIPFTEEEEAEADALQMELIETLNDPNQYQLTDRQLRLGLINAGIMPSDIDNIIKSIEDPVQKETLWTWWDRSSIINWDHPMRVYLTSIVGLSEDEAKAMWLAAKNIE